MDWTVISSILKLVVMGMQYAPQVMAAWNQPVGTMQKLQQIAATTPIEDELAALGAKLMPGLAPEFHAAAALLQIVHPTPLMYVQGGLNMISQAGVFKMPAAVKKGTLDIDGLWGPETTAAAKAAEAKANIPLSGAINDMLVNWIGGQLQKLG